MSKIRGRGREGEREQGRKGEGVEFIRRLIPKTCSKHVEDALSNTF
jgi:hypothetical protein